MKTLSLACVLVALLWLPSACSFSASSASISHSISSPFTSSSASSKSDQTRYEEDVTAYTRSFVAAGGGAPGSFQRGIADLAATRGISDWESNQGTWEAVGRGLREAKISDAEMMAYQRSWTGGDPVWMERVQKGYSGDR